MYVVVLVVRGLENTQCQECVHTVPISTDYLLSLSTGPFRCPQKTQFHWHCRRRCSGLKFHTSVTITFCHSILGEKELQLCQAKKVKWAVQSTIKRTWPRQYNYFTDYAATNVYILYQGIIFHSVMNKSDFVFTMFQSCWFIARWQVTTSKDGVKANYLFNCQRIKCK